MSNIVNFQDKLEEFFEQGKLFVECQATIEDDLGVYALEGECYEVVNMDEATFVIEGEDDMMLQFLRDDNDFRIFIER